ncbi:DUF4113 domain-containing protein [Microvirga sp. STR05]|uniref:DUF4113 domain-containing protein n=1 Tax=Hymenobacter duratus TaxID=2771356 RepID=A0ABR8JPJ4_9BACT|nr:DUF4113 domain-containing protein [Hymenobacter duratus]MBD2716714.1 DUF4113 domain-containing protein [Hymenobacter duratus]MBR7951629.1 DUF4113 domain-containing protein [Microvirga sp. STR05]
MPATTSNTLDLVSYAHAILLRIWQPGTIYVKAGVDFDGFEAAGQPQLNLFEKGPEITRPQSVALMQQLDKLNFRYGRATVQVAAALSPKGQTAPWQGQTQHRTPARITSWDELWEVGLVTSVNNAFTHPSRHAARKQCPLPPNRPLNSSFTFTFQRDFHGHDFYPVTVPRRHLQRLGSGLLFEYVADTYLAQQPAEALRFTRSTILFPLTHGL